MTELVDCATLRKSSINRKGLLVFLPRSFFLKFAVLLLAAWTQSATAYDLRAFQAYVGLPPNGDTDHAAVHYLDLFNNGDPLVGGSFEGAVTGVGSYSPTVGSMPSPGSELNGPDTDAWGVNLGAGRLQLSRADAKRLTGYNLSAPGTYDTSNSLRLNDPGNTPLLTKGQSTRIESYWNLVTPEVGSRYGVRLSDSPTVQASSPFNDFVQLSVTVDANGNPLLHFFRLTYDGSNWSTSPQDSQFKSLSNAIFQNGRSLSDALVLEMDLSYNAAGAGDPTLVTASFQLLDGLGDTIGAGTFSKKLSIFNGEDFTHAAVVTGFTETLPEPAGLLLVLTAILGLVGSRRARC